jgi:hypothetical protein
VHRRTARHYTLDYIIHPPLSKFIATIEWDYNK